MIHGDNIDLNEALGNNGARQTGNTFRSILMGLMLASSGKNVLFTSWCYESASEQYLSAVGICDAGCVAYPKYKHKSNADKVIKFQNGGTLKFVSMHSVENSLRGTRGYIDHVITDNACMLKSDEMDNKIDTLMGWASE